MRRWGQLQPETGHMQQGLIDSVLLLVTSFLWPSTSDYFNLVHLAMEIAPLALIANSL